MASKERIKVAVRFLVSLPIALAVAFVVFPKRWLLVDMTEVPNFPVNLRWYYQPFHCSFLPPWDQISTGSPFCIAFDIRLLILVPLGVACLVTWLWMKSDDQ